MTPTGGRPLTRFSVLDLTTVRSGPAAWGPHEGLALPVHLSRAPAVVEWAAPMAGGVIEQHKGETK